MIGPPIASSDRVLLRLPSWLGDLVMAEPAVRAVHGRVLGEHGAGALSLAAPAKLLPLFDGMFPGAERLAHEGRGGERASAWRGHDVALLLTGSFRSAWTAWRAGIGRRVGFARDGRSWLLTQWMRPALERGALPFSLGVHGRGWRFLPRPFGADCAELLGLCGIPVSDTRPRLAVAPDSERAMRARLAGLGLEAGAPFVLVNAGARPGSAKGFPPRAWAEVLDLLARELDGGAVLVGGPGEGRALAEVAAATRRARPLVVDDPPADLGELAALCSLASLVLSADAGPRHVANAVGTPLVCIVGPTDPRHTADHLGTTALVRHPVDCGPCHFERCPISGEGHHACMERVDPEQVAERATELLLDSAR